MKVCWVWKEGELKFMKVSSHDHADEKINKENRMCGGDGDGKNTRNENERIRE